MAAHTVDHAMTTTSVGHCLQKMLLFNFKGCRSLLIKRIPSWPPNMFQMGFLTSELTKFSELYKCILAQITSVHPGSSVAVIISCLPEETIKQMTINSIDDTDSEAS